MDAKGLPTVTTGRRQMRDLSLALAQPLFRKKIKSDPASVSHLNLALLALIVTFGFLYLFQINSLGTRGYEIRQMEQKIKVLQTENKSLQIQSSALSSITQIQKEAEGLNMVPASNVTYLKEADFALK
jgi:cell division protein FtsL